MAIAHLLNTSLEVWRAATVSDGGGGQSTSWQQQAAVRARLSQPSARERTAADQSGSDLTHIVYLTPGVDVRRGDELRAAGRVFEVLAVLEPSMPGTYLRADCTARQTE
ncbi:phage head closure protein [Streptomyces meridianus]|uniref:Phage head closure protein n=1 Tax=Streptomyces meridianus TaxID=2938945 RepID=A0ABT0XD41_9ACTN|nr:phage head closure protein [Streptomyces meridianus]MCM2580448.1 phage head closure protein [Streptomyces meridianus]